MTGHVSFGPPPQTVPVLPAYIPVDVDMTMIKAQVAATGVSAAGRPCPVCSRWSTRRTPTASTSRSCCSTTTPERHPLRDISTVVGADYHDATVLTLSPSYVGSYSTQFPRVTLEAGEDIAKTGNPVVSAQHFLHELDTPEFPWTGLTIFLLIAVFAAAVGTRLLQVRGERSATSDESATAEDAEANTGS